MSLAKGKQIKTQTITISGNTGHIIVLGDLNMGVNNVNVTNQPTLPNQLSNKSYVDTKQVQLSGVGFVKINGNTISYDNITYQSFIETGTTLQYYRGDKSFQILNTTVVPEGTGLYFNSARTLAVSLGGFVQNSAFTQLNSADTLLSSFNKIDYDLYYLNANKNTNVLTLNSMWIGNSSNIATETQVINEWVVGANLPGQKEYKGLMTDMIISDGSIISIPTIVTKNVILTTTGLTQLLSDTYTGSYYVIESIVLICRSLSISQYPTISIGCNASTYNDIAASQTLNTLTNGLNIITLTTNASKALIQANTNMYLKVTNNLISSGTVNIMIKGYLTKI